MFRCQFSGEVSEGPVYKTKIVTDVDEEGKERKANVRVLVKAAESPIRVTIEVRQRNYTNTYRDPETLHRYDTETSGTEIVKELMVRERHVAAIKAKYGLE